MVLSRSLSVLSGLALVAVAAAPAMAAEFYRGKQVE